MNRENTRYTNENGWFVSEKVRFRQGTPEKLGGWSRVSDATYLGTCRSLWNWISNDGFNYMGTGTNLKYYVEIGGVYYDITPIRTTISLGTDPFTGNGTTTVTVTTPTAHGANINDFVTFSGATGTYNSIFNAEFQIVSVPTTTTFTITTSSVIAAGSYGGSSVSAAFQIPVGYATQQPTVGWGAGGWGLGPWGIGASGSTTFRLWNAQNFGEDLLYGYRGGPLYYWDSSAGTSNRGVLVDSLGGTVTLTIASPCIITLTNILAEGTAIKLATTGTLPTGLTAGTTYYLRNVDGVTANLSATPAGAIINTSGTQSGVHSISELVDVPKYQNWMVVSDTSRFVLVFGTNEIGSSVLDPMLIRWSAQESVTDWVPNIATNQAGSIRLSHGSEIVCAIQSRQEIVTLTDSSVYSLQYVGPPYVWSSQLLGDNISIAGPNAAVFASGSLYWMGVDKFYVYDGRINTLQCDLRKYVFQDINLGEQGQFFAGTNEGFNEVWWFYCSANSATIDRYVVYNYLEKVWYYGSMARTAWLDSPLRDYPTAANPAVNRLVYHEYGNDDQSTSTPQPIEAYIESAEFDIDDGQNFGMIWRMLPDLTFSGSTVENPQLTMTLQALNGSGSGINQSASEGVTRTSTVTIEQFTNIIYTRLRGRQMIIKASSSGLGVAWQLGAPRIDIRQDGRR